MQQGFTPFMIDNGLPEGARFGHPESELTLAMPNGRQKSHLISMFASTWRLNGLGAPLIFTDFRTNQASSNRADWRKGSGSPPGVNGSRRLGVNTALSAPQAPVPGLFTRGANQSHSILVTVNEPNILFTTPPPTRRPFSLRA